MYCKHLYLIIIFENHHQTCEIKNIFRISKFKFQIFRFSDFQIFRFQISDFQISDFQIFRFSDFQISDVHMLYEFEFIFSHAREGSKYYPVLSLSIPYYHVVHISV